MKKITLSAMVGLAVCLASGCDNKGDGNDNYSTSTEYPGKGPLDELSIEDNREAQKAVDSAEISTGAPVTFVYASDSNFVSMAANSGIFEVQAGDLAITKASSAEVKKYGTQMKADHTKANTELNEIARRKGWYPQQRANVEQKATYNRLSQLSGQEFDREYMAAMVSSHEMAVAMFEQASQKATDADLRAFASRTLPALRMHLDMARDLHNKMQNT